jgi:ribosomal protein S14
VSSLLRTVFIKISMIRFYARNAGITRDKKRRKNFKEYESFLLASKCLKGCNFTKSFKGLHHVTSSSLTRTRNRCLLTGRSSVVYSKLRLSRFKFREKVLSGLFPGVGMAVW